MLNRFWIRIAACWLSSAATVLQSAKADIFDDLEVHGFATQGYVKTSDNNFFGDSEEGSFEFYELGVNASVEPSPSVRLSGQLLARRAGEMSYGSPKLDFAVADFSIASSHAWKLNMLAGRVKNPLGLFNDTRDVAFTRPGIFLPQTVYFQSVRSLALSADGVAVRANGFTESGNLEFQAGLGRPLIDENVEYAYLGRSLKGDYRADGISWVGRLLFETPAETWRFALSGAGTSLSFRPKYGDLITAGNTDIIFAVASAQYVARDWTLSAEYVIEPIEYKGFVGTPYDGANPTLEGYYLQLNWRAFDRVELMFRLEEGCIDRSDCNGRGFEALTGLPAHSRYLRASVFGIRWDPVPDLMLRAEFQRSNGTLILSNRENPDPFKTVTRWNMFSLSASYRF